MHFRRYGRFASSNRRFLQELRRQLLLTEKEKLDFLLAVAETAGKIADKPIWLRPNCDKGGMNRVFAPEPDTKNRSPPREEV
ncbi:MAG: hypothetical protein JEZ11_05470 [Desulfobacterales bacterium]|nr:hypothetical protein [Desulfobacterales bacterium]